MEIKFDQTQFDGLGFLRVNATFTSLKVKIDSVLVQYRAGVPAKLYEATQAENERLALYNQTKKYLQVYHQGQLVAPDIELPTHLGSIVHWSAAGLITFQTEAGVREHAGGTMFYQYRLGPR
ncbi:MAG: hypothetical protein MUC97_17975 [Bernardetiaceae bacterium]|jgi:hypothetical protein|nr:hypothetical protein [Bernardetiaceae bacterium]